MSILRLCSTYVPYKWQRRPSKKRTIRNGVAKAVLHRECESTTRKIVYFSHVCFNLGFRWGFCFHDFNSSCRCAHKQNNWNEKYEMFVAKIAERKPSVECFLLKYFFFRRLFFCYGDGALFTLTCTHTPSRLHICVIIQANTRPNRLINHIGYEARTNSSRNIFSELFIHFSLESEFFRCRRRN